MILCNILDLDEKSKAGGVERTVDNNLEERASLGLINFFVRPIKGNYY